MIPRSAFITSDHLRGQGNISLMLKAQSSKERAPSAQLSALSHERSTPSCEHIERPAIPPAAGPPVVRRDYGNTSKKPQDGFILFELIATLVLIGVIGAFAGLFLYTGINGFIASKRNSETALAAQIALDRISAELRRVSSVTAAVANTSITYRSKDLTGTRTIRYDSGAKIIYFNRDGVENPLLDKVATFSLAWDSANMDNAGGDEISSINIGFTIADVGTQFNVRMHPRSFIPKP